MSEDELRAVNEKLNQYNNFPERDGVVIPEDLYDAYERDEAAPVEMLLFRLPAIRQGQTHALHGNRVYMYYWKFPSTLPDLGACHAVELAYVFNNLDDTIYTGENVNRELAARVQQMWVNFALTGNPSLPELHWKPYTREARWTMLLDETLTLKVNLHETGRRLLYPLTKYRFNGNYTAASSTVLPPAAKAALAAAGVGTAALLLWLLLREKEG